MSANFYELLKYAATGIASQSMTYYDKMRASTLMGGAVQTLTGQPPLSFKADGTPLISWSMLGNGSQTGTPTHDNPVMPTFCGVRTTQLFDENNAGYGEWVNSNGAIVTKAPYAAFQEYEIGSATKFVAKYHGVKPYSHSISFYDSNGDFISRTHRSNPSESGDRFDVPSNATKARYQVAVNTSTETMSPEKLKQFKIMLNAGDTALPYEPYGWAEKITCAGQTTPVYLGQVSTVRRVKKLVLTGEELWQKSGAYKGSFYAQVITNYLSLTYDAYCTHAAHVPTLSQYSKGKMVFKGGVIANCNLWFNQFDENTTVEEFKSYLAAQYTNGTPVTVWYALAEPQTAIVNEPLAKIGDFADELHSTDAGVTIPTIKGSNTLTVETELQPSEMSITYKG